MHRFILLVLDFGVLCRGLLGRPFGLLPGVQALSDLHGDRLESARLGFDVLGVLALHGRAQIDDGRVDAIDNILRQLVLVLAHRLFRGVNQGIGIVAGIDGSLARLVLLRVALGVVHHLIDLALGQPAAGLDRD
mmetsp:Transcript_6650/g.18447  ORF Transcript_6650/g.18447 Transcript_6650/m.18447 type:complete len:134 (+) Transcript_6650:223-624(+)